MYTHIICVNNGRLLTAKFFICVELRNGQMNKNRWNDIVSLYLRRQYLKYGASKSEGMCIGDAMACCTHNHQ